MFREPQIANPAISFGGGYLTVPNIGIQGSRGAAAIPLLATMIAWGINGFANRIDHAMSMASKLASVLSNEESISLWAMPKTGVTVFRSRAIDTEAFYRNLPEGMFSTCILGKEKWLRSVAANPLADIEEIILTLSEVIHGDIA